MACEFLTQITELVKQELPVAENITDKLIQFADAISEGGPEEREKALEFGAYFTICNAWAQCSFSGVEGVLTPGPDAVQVRDAVLRALYTITAGHPEIIDELGWQIITQSIDKPNSEEAHILALRVIRNVSIHSEENRENFTWNYGLMDTVVSLIIRDNPTSALVQEWCATMKALCLTDDPRVVYNRAPERKRVINQTKVLPTVAGLVSQKDYEKDAGALNAMIVFLGTMAVNEDVCHLIWTGNVLPGLANVFKNHFNNKTLIRNTIALLRYLCVEINIRERCSSYPLLKGVLDVIIGYKKEPDVIDVAYSCIAVMTLRSACQVKQFMARNGLNLTLQVMKEYKSDMTIMKGCCFTLRNVYENGGLDGKERISEAGFLSILTELLTTVPELKEFYVMPILREFGDAVATEEESAAEIEAVTDSVTVTPAAALPPSSSAAAEEVSPSSNEESLPVSHPEEEVTEAFGEAAEENI